MLRAVWARGIDLCRTKRAARIQNVSQLEGERYSTNPRNAVSAAQREKSGEALRDGAKQVMIAAKRRHSSQQICHLISFFSAFDTRDKKSFKDFKRVK